MESAEFTHTIAVYASATADGDPDWAKVMTNVGMVLARNNVRMVCPAGDGMLCRPLVTSARSAGGTVLLIADSALDDASVPSGVLVEIVDEVHARRQRISDLAEAFIGLPCTLTAIQSLYASWILSGGGESGKPVALLNRNRAFEVFRGYTNDVLSQGLENADRLMMFSENFDELWGKLRRTLGATD